MSYIKENPGNPYETLRTLAAINHGIDFELFEITTMKLKASIKLFLLNKTDETKSTYTQIITDWITFQPEHRLLNPTVQDVFKYLSKLSRKPGQKTRYDSGGSFSPTTMRKYVVGLRSFYKLLCKLNLARTNPFADPCFDLKTFKASQKRPTEFVEFSSVQTMLDAYRPNSKVGIRNRAMIAMLFNIGLRRSEIRRLQMQDLQTTPDGVWFVHLRHTKSKHDRRPALSDWGLGPILLNRNQRIIDCARNSDPFFIGYDQKTQNPLKVPLSPKTIYGIVKHAAKRAGLSDAIAVHSGRATAISKMLSEHAEYREVREVTGHASVQMVESYDKRTFGPGKTASKRVGY